MSSHEVKWRWDEQWWAVIGHEGTMVIIDWLQAQHNQALHTDELTCFLNSYNKTATNVLKKIAVCR